MTTQKQGYRATDPHPDDEEGKHPLDVKGQSYAAQELRDNMAVNDYTHDDKGNRTGGRMQTSRDRTAEERSAEFLVEEFNVQTPDAADLVADDPAEAEAIEDRERERQDRADPLADVPTPVDHQFSPAERVQKHMHKEVVREPKE